ncbi:MAG: iron ABC transporter permease [Gemmatimonadetes bacterium]|nr:iron ABC transporter permease [Gemmatimonadota bacterium]
MTSARWLLLFAVLAVAGAAGLAIGPVSIGVVDVVRALAGSGDAQSVAIVRDLRLARVCLAMIAGAVLGMSGAALQGTLRNALAEPYLLGVSGGAAMGAVLAVVAGLTAAVALPVAAFGGAASAVALVLVIARVTSGRADPRVLLMAGVVVGAFANAAIMVLLAGAGEGTVRNALWWMMGSVAGAEWVTIRWLAFYALVAGTLLVAVARDIDLLALGEDAAAGLGVRVSSATRRIFLLSALLAAVTVAGAGLVGFVGLVVPAIARAFGIRRARELLLASAVLGAALVVGADVVARTVRAPAELPLGAVTALVGVPFFLVRLRRAA